MPPATLPHGVFAFVLDAGVRRPSDPPTALVTPSRVFRNLAWFSALESEAPPSASPEATPLGLLFFKRPSPVTSPSEGKSSSSPGRGVPSFSWMLECFPLPASLNALGPRPAVAFKSIMGRGALCARPSLSFRLAAGAASASAMLRGLLEFLPPAPLPENCDPRDAGSLRLPCPFPPLSECCEPCGAATSKSSPRALGPLLGFFVACGFCAEAPEAATSKSSLRRVLSLRSSSSLFPAALPSGSVRVA